ncbi:MAG: ribonuclease HII [Candidatus Omnitrophica bacterium]|nr:ribonuclease HII [Candidatus Omnitrophota bacterium]MDD5592375.1 ribonuclease HII [Candidatus Omnitrophota bacterium]
MLYYERKLKKRGYDFIIGVDEAGRGPLAGPVVAAAVTLRTVSFKNRIDDSKKLTALQRERAFFEITQKSVFGVGVINEKIIDNLNILVATRRAMEAAILALVNKLKEAPEKRIHVIIDGNMGLDISLPFTTIIKGDAKSKTIACASIIAKVIRDRIMSVYDKVYPQYGFLQHKGYPTKQHRRLIKRFGPSRIHRKTFLGCVNNI